MSKNKPKLQVRDLKDLKALTDSAKTLKDDNINKSSKDKSKSKS